MEKLTKKSAGKLPFNSLREYAKQFGVKGTGKKEIMRELEEANGFAPADPTPEKGETLAASPASTAHKKFHWEMVFSQAVKVAGVGLVLPNKVAKTDREEVARDAKRSPHLVSCTRVEGKVPAAKQPATPPEDPAPDAE